MKVLQHGKHWVAPEYPKRKRCDCGCVFLFGYEDTVANYDECRGRKVYCPECGKCYQIK